MEAFLRFVARSRIAFPRITVKSPWHRFGELLSFALSKVKENGEWKCDDALWAEDMTLAMLAGQFISRDIEPGKSVRQVEAVRSLCAAKRRLGISDGRWAVLNALLSFYPENTLSGETGLVVFPSNVQLSLRAHGMAEATLRRHLAALVEAGLVARKDSPNGKRYARKSRDGAIGTAYGFFARTAPAAPAK